MGQPGYYAHHVRPLVHMPFRLKIINRCRFGHICRRPNNNMHVRVDLPFSGLNSYSSRHAIVSFPVHFRNEADDEAARIRDGAGQYGGDASHWLVSCCRYFHPSLLACSESLDTSTMVSLHDGLHILKGEFCSTSCVSVPVGETCAGRDDGLEPP